MTDKRDFVIEHIRERLRRLASQQDMLTCEHMLEGADEIERLTLERDKASLLAVNRLIEIDRLTALVQSNDDTAWKLTVEIEQMRERIHTLITEREAERKIYNDAIASHLDKIKQLQSKIDALSVILELRWQDVERLEAELEEWRTGERP